MRVWWTLESLAIFRAWPPRRWRRGLDAAQREKVPYARALALGRHCVHPHDIVLQPRPTHNTQTTARLRCACKGPAPPSAHCARARFAVSARGAAAARSRRVGLATAAARFLACAPDGRPSCTGRKDKFATAQKFTPMYASAREQAALTTCRLERANCSCASRRVTVPIARVVWCRMCMCVCP